jgi:hypothetical protein
MYMKAGLDSADPVTGIPDLGKLFPNLCHFTQSLAGYPELFARFVLT